MNCRFPWLRLRADISKLSVTIDQRLKRTACGRTVGPARYARSAVLFSAILFSAVYGAPANADSISPNIGDTGKVYSTETSDSAYFGGGIGGRLSEASHLRFKGDHFISINDFDSAITVLLKAVQLEPGYPEGHLLLARAMTAKIKRSKDAFDWELFNHCMDEWKMLSKHDADFGEQLEARSNMATLKKLAKAQGLPPGKEKKEKRMLLGGKMFGLFK